MTAAELLADLAHQGFTLALERNGIRVMPASRLTEELRQALRKHKPALFALLAERQPRPSALVWDQAEASRLLAELRVEVERINRKEFTGTPPALWGVLAADLLAIGEGYVRHHDLEAARGWDALELLRGLLPLTRQTAARVKAMAVAG